MGPLQASRIQRRSCQLTIDCSRAVVTSAYNIGPSPGTTIFGNFINPPSARKAANQRGFVRNWLTNGSIIPSLRLRSSLTPFRRSRSRIPATGVSMVTTRAEKAAVRAQCQLGLRAAVDIVKYYAGKSPFGDTTQIFDIEHARRLNRLRHASYAIKA